jgi:hypothetical protein
MSRPSIFSGAPYSGSSVGERRRTSLTVLAALDRTANDYGEAQIVVLAYDADYIAGPRRRHDRRNGDHARRSDGLGYRDQSPANWWRPVTSS